MKVLKFDQFLLEMQFSSTYKDITKTYPLSFKNQSSKSVVEPDTVSPYGWKEVILYNEDGVPVNAFGKDKLDTNEVLTGFLFDNQELVPKVPKILSNAISNLANSETLRNFKPQGYEYYILDLGKIAMWNGKIEMYPIFVPSAEEGKKYRGGHFYAVGVKSLFEPSLLTFFYSEDPDKISSNYLAHQALFHLRKAKDKKIDEKEFMDNYTVVEPYGKNFILTVDFTQYSPEYIEKDIIEQLNLKEKKSPIAALFAAKRKETIQDFVPVGQRGLSQISITPGKTIGLIIPYINKEDFTNVVIKDILNIKNIKGATKVRKGLGEIDGVEISYTIPGDDTGKTGRTFLKRGTRLQWKPKGGPLKSSKIPDEIPSFITPDINLISAGTVPIKVLE